jgi:hypothetical protein
MPVACPWQPADEHVDQSGEHLTCGAGPNHAPAARITVNLGENIAKYEAQRKYDGAGRDRERPERENLRRDRVSQQQRCNVESRDDVQKPGIRERFGGFLQFPRLGRHRVADPVGFRLARTTSISVAARYGFWRKLVIP